MKSKQALEELERINKRQNNGNGDIWLEMIIQSIGKDLEILEILKKHIYFSSKSGCVRMKDIYKSINNFDFEDLKDWLSNE